MQKFKKSVPLQRFREGNALRIWHSDNEVWVLRLISHFKIFQKKLFEKFGGYKNLTYLCSRFPKESHSKRVLWKILNKQTNCSTTQVVLHLVCKMKEKTVNTFKSKDRFGFLNRLQTDSSNGIVKWYFTKKSLILAQDER